MQKINIFYWLILPLLLVAAYMLIAKLNLSHQEYFGYAENKQSEINLDKDVTVSKILVKTGDQVKKGQLLVIVANPDVSQEINQISIALGGIKIKNELTSAELKAEMLKLEHERDMEISAVQSKISNMEHEIGFYKSFVGQRDLNVKNEIVNPNEEILQNLRKELTEIRNSYDRSILHYKKMMSQPKETLVSHDQFSNKRAYLSSEAEKFNITAPFDGTIGSINVHEGENVKAFTSLISYYESTPPMVLAYVQEKFDIKINVGDSVYITSIYNVNKKTKGAISAKGNRIVEIPEKFRKIPDVKLYGREVFINIPTNNGFLQKELLRISQNQ